jgi:hypothetical protein
VEAAEQPEAGPSQPKGKKRTMEVVVVIEGKPLKKKKTVSRPEVSEDGDEVQEVPGKNKAKKLPVPCKK